MLGVTTVALSGFCFGCTSSTNEPNVAKGDGAPASTPPKDMKEWYEKNKMPTQSKKGAAKSAPGPEAAK